MRLPLPFAIGAISASDAAGVSELLAEARAADGFAPLDPAALALLPRDEPWLTHVVAHNRAGQVVGYLQVNRSGEVATARLVVRPDARRGGVGRVLLRLAQQDVTIPQFSGPPGADRKRLQVVADGQLDAAVGFAQAMGFRPVAQRSEPDLSAPERAAGRADVTYEQDSDAAPGSSYATK